MELSDGNHSNIETQNKENFKGKKKKKKKKERGKARF